VPINMLQLREWRLRGMQQLVIDRLDPAIHRKEQAYGGQKRDVPTIWRVTRKDGGYWPARSSACAGC